MTTLRSGSATHVGQVRSNNQDSFLVLADADLYGVADGMGGHAGGEIASAMAVELLEAHAGEPSLENLMEAARLGNRAIFEKAGGDPELHGMGTTLCAVRVVPGADGELHYLGRAGSGIAPGDIDDIARTLAGIERKTPPVARIPDADRRDARWVTPTLVGEVAYSELTPQGRLRAPSWRGWRPDLSASDVRWEGAGALPTP